MGEILIRKKKEEVVLSLVGAEKKKGLIQQGDRRGYTRGLKLSKEALQWSSS